MTPTITLTDAPGAHARNAILTPLLRFNLAGGGRAEDYRHLAILLSDPDTGEAVGGLWGATYYAQLQIDLLFIPEPLRQSGLGRRLTDDAEA
jgi:hypothetical protein